MIVAQLRRRDLHFLGASVVDALHIEFEWTRRARQGRVNALLLRTALASPAADVGPAIGFQGFREEIRCSLPIPHLLGVHDLLVPRRDADCELYTDVLALLDAVGVQGPLEDLPVVIAHWALAVDIGRHQRGRGRRAGHSLRALRSKIDCDEAARLCRRRRTAQRRH